MKSVFVVCLMISAVLSAPAPEKDSASILSYENNNIGVGPYNFAFQTSDGISRQEEANVVNADNPEKSSLVVKGSYSYVAPDGVTYTVNYIADENGYRVL